MLLFAILFSCTTPDKDTGEELLNPADFSILEVGPYEVGYTTVNHSTIDPLGLPLELSMNIWYPSMQTNNDHPTYFNIVEDEMSSTDVDLAPQDERGLFPVMVFSHGSFLYGASSSFLARHFASHGWVVVAPDHHQHLLSNYTDGVNISVHYHRPISNAASIDVLENTPMFMGKTDTENVLLTGFSFGGYDNWVSVGAKLSREGFIAACDADELNGECSEEQYDVLENGFSDSRFTAIIPMAGASQLDKFQAGGRNDINVPVFQISGSDDDDSPQQVFDETNGVDFMWLDIPDGCHAMFSVGGCPNIDTQTGYQIIQTYTLAFALQHITQDANTEAIKILIQRITPWTGMQILQK